MRDLDSLISRLCNVAMVAAAGAIKARGLTADDVDLDAVVAELRASMTARFVPACEAALETTEALGELWGSKALNAEAMSIGAEAVAAVLAA